MLTVGLAGTAMPIGLLALIQLGDVRDDSVRVGHSIALTAFAPCLIVAALGCRSRTGTVLTALALLALSELGELAGQG
ncbi:hypothetical protein [Streptomyces sp. NPDC057302]|uniref:hypothetical protein n=1 Tax=Streptomyces sp. NPDC057302 TaxID=3346094 RepID=UPI0036429372